MVLGRLIRFSSKNIFNNLAAEELSFQRTVGHALLFYVNSDCVVLGRTQNPFNEADVAYAAAHNIPIARRRSGGGTVVHDCGNLNFCFMRPRSEHEPLSNARMISNVLCAEFNIEAHVNHRADILVEGRKISGAAYRISKDRAYHHGTLLVNSNLDSLRRLLKAPLSAGIETMGAKSVSSPVTRLADHYHGSLTMDDITEAIARNYSPSNSNIQVVSAEDMKREHDDLQDEIIELSSHAWVYGQAPKFSSQLRFRNICLRFHIRKGAVIQRVEVLGNDDVQTLGKTEKDFVISALEGTPFDGCSMTQSLLNGSPSDNVKELALAIRDKIPFQYWKDRPEAVPSIGLRSPPQKEQWNE